MSFEHYKQQQEARIRRLRRDLDNDNGEWIVEANSPFRFEPDNPNPEKGIVLIHGLFDCPFVMHDLGRFFQQQGFLVQGILLEAHGTIPEQLKDVDYQQWVENVSKAVNSIRKVVKDVYLGGFSTGALLAMHHCLTDKNIKGVITLCPAIKLNTTIALGTRLLLWTKKVIERDYWNIDKPEHDDTKYTEYPMNAPYQVARLVEAFDDLNKKLSLNTPLFLAISADDETVSGPAALDFFTHNPGEHNKMLYYTNDHLDSTDSRVTLIASAHPDKNILDYSHISLPISPDNVHYGEHRDYQLPIHYQDKTDKRLYWGALTRHNLKKHNLQRLSYNPSFVTQCNHIKAFLESLD